MGSMIGHALGDPNCQMLATFFIPTLGGGAQLFKRLSSCKMVLPPLPTGCSRLPRQKGSTSLDWSLRTHQLACKVAWFDTSRFFSSGNIWKSKFMSTSLTALMFWRQESKKSGSPFPCSWEVPPSFYGKWLTVEVFTLNMMIKDKFCVCPLFFVIALFVTFTLECCSNFFWDKQILKITMLKFGIFHIFCKTKWKRFFKSHVAIILMQVS